MTRRPFASGGEPRTRRGGLVALLRIACIISCIAFLVHAVTWAPRLTYGFAMYYTYARLVLTGETLAGVYGEEYFNAKVHEYGFDLRDEPNNLPTAALAYIPVAWPGPAAGKVLWTIASVAFFAWALMLLFRLSGIPPGGVPGLVLLTLVLLWHPGWQAVALGQVYILLLLVFLLFIRWLPRSDALSGLFLGSAAIMKGYGAVPAVLLAVKGRWIVIGVSAVAALGVALATLPWLGAESWKAFFGFVLTSLGSRSQDANVAYQTVNGFVRHLFTYDTAWLPHPLVVAPPWIIAVISIGANLLLILAAVLAFRKAGEGEQLLAYGGAIAAGVMTAPLAEEYHYVLLLPLLFGLAGKCAAWRMRGGRPGLPEALGAAGALVAAAPSATHALQDASYPLVLLAYGKLGAGLALLGAAAFSIRRGLTNPPAADHA